MAPARCVRIITLNLEHDGGPDEEGGIPPTLWRYVHEHVLAPLRPDLLLRQEMTYSALNRKRRLGAACKVLGMRGFLSPNGSGRNPTGLFLRPATFEVVDPVEYRRYWRTPPTAVIAWLDGAPGRDIAMMSWHAAFNSPRGREREADEVAGVVDKMKAGRHFIVGGDCNEYPVPQGEVIPPIDWASEEIIDLPHVRHRTNKAPDGSRGSCTYIDETLLGCGMHDPARYAYHTLKQKDALNGTTDSQRTARQGGSQRIDRIYLDPWLIRAVEEVRVVDISDPEDTTGRPKPDHHAVVVDLSYAGAIEALHRRVEPLPPLPIAV